MKKLNLVVLGGGTAGWLTALFMNRLLPQHSVTLVQSKQVGIIGVGEATTPHIISFLKRIHVDPLEVIKHTNGSVKNGIHFENWNGDGKSYFHSFSENLIDFRIDRIFGTDCSEWYLKNCMKHNLDLQEYTYGARITYENKIDLDNIGWALHFDATALANYLQNIGQQRGINLIEGDYQNVNNDAEGNIVKLNLKNGISVDVDFIFDCSGFSKLLIGNHYKQKWVSFSDHLPMKKGIPFWLDEPEVMKPYTSSIAMKYGWMWQIPLQHRTGSGYIFDSDYIDEEQALLEAEQYYGQKLEIRKIIPFEPGRYENYWIKNCMALGLSSCFIEPLESTSLWFTMVQLENFAHYLSELKHNPSPRSIEKFNTNMKANMDEILNFVYLHYLTKRNDSEFWKNFRSDYPPPSSLVDILECVNEKNLRWNNINVPGSDLHFALFSWLQVTYGQELITDDIDITNYENINPTPKEYKKIIDSASQQIALDHKSFLRGLKGV